MNIYTVRIKNKMEKFDHLLTAEICDEFERWLEGEDTEYFGAQWSEVEEYIPGIVLPPNTNPDLFQPPTNTALTYTPTDKSVLEAMARTPLGRLEEPRGRPLRLEFPPRRIELPPVVYRRRDTSFKCEPNPAEGFRPIKIEEPRPAQRKFVEVKIPNGPVASVPIGVPMYRVRHEGMQWRLRLDKATGAVRHIGKGKREFIAC